MRESDASYASNFSTQHPTNNKGPITTIHAVQRSIFSLSHVLVRRERIDDKHVLGRGAAQWVGHVTTNKPPAALLVLLTIRSLASLRRIVAHRRSDNPIPIVRRPANNYLLSLTEVDDVAFVFLEPLPQSHRELGLFREHHLLLLITAVTQHP